MISCEVDQYVYEKDHTNSTTQYDANKSCWFTIISYWMTILATIWSVLYYLLIVENTTNSSTTVDVRGEPYAIYKKRLSFTNFSNNNNTQWWRNGISNNVDDDNNAIFWFYNIIIQFHLPFLLVACLSTILVTSNSTNNTYGIRFWLNQIITRSTSCKFGRRVDHHDHHNDNDDIDTKCSDDTSSISSVITTASATTTMNTTTTNTIEDSNTKEKKNQKSIKKNQYGYGDTNMKLIIIIIIVIPTITLILKTLPSAYRIASMLYDQQFNDDVSNKNNSTSTTSYDSFMKLYINYISYSFGWTSIVLLSFFLIPVSRHSIVLVTLNWNPIHALLIHIWLGYLSFICAMIHGLLIFVTWIIPDEIVENNNNNNISSSLSIEHKRTHDYFYSNQWIPSSDCWFNGNKMITSTLSSCKNQWHNMTGIVTLLCFIILCATSLPIIRRMCYRIFYMNHMIFGTLFLVGAICHVKYVFLYILPSLLYYFITTIPTYIQAFTSYIRGGIHIDHIVTIPQSNNTIEIHITIDNQTNQLIKNHPNQYVKLCIPQISYIWHPFTVYYHPMECIDNNNNDGCNKLRILIQPTGYFTKDMSRRLSSTSCRLSLATSATTTKSEPTMMSTTTTPTTTLLMDGLYRGSNHCHVALHHHDHITIVAGGVAITPYLSLTPFLLQELRMKSRMKSSRRLQSIVLIWSCRHIGLLSYIAQNYFISFIDMAKDIDPEFTFEIKVFCTASDQNLTDGPLAPMFDDECIEDNETTTTKQVVMTNNVLITSNSSSSSASREVFDRKLYINDRCSGINSGNGHPMEICRMMPAQNSLLIQNIPNFILYLTPICFVYYYTILSYRNNKAIHSLNEVLLELKRLGSIILVFVIVGCFIELVYFFRRLSKIRLIDNANQKHNGTDEEDDLVLKEGSETKSFLTNNKTSTTILNKEETSYGACTSMDCHSLQDIESQQKHFCFHPTDMMMSSSSGYSRLRYHVGRPDVINDILIEANTASAPGIFMCGPTSMMTSIRQEAKKDDSIYGFTRYAFYEEAFEM